MCLLCCADVIYQQAKYGLEPMGTPWTMFITFFKKSLKLFFKSLVKCSVTRMCYYRNLCYQLIKTNKEAWYQSKTLDLDLL